MNHYCSNRMSYLNGEEWKSIGVVEKSTGAVARIYVVAVVFAVAVAVGVMMAKLYLVIYGHIHDTQLYHGMEKSSKNEVFN